MPDWKANDASMRVQIEPTTRVLRVQPGAPLRASLSLAACQSVTQRPLLAGDMSKVFVNPQNTNE
jgi:hypothetical protein